MALYSVIYAGGCAFVQTLATCIVAYATARFDFKLSKIIYSTVLILMVLPIIGSLPSELQLTKNLGLYDTLFGPLVLKFNFIGMYYLVFYATFRGVPKAYTEAAKIDGASNMRIMTRIILPLIKNTFLTIMLINFVAYWNDYQTPLVYIPSYPTMAYGLYLYNFSTISEISDTPMKIAGCMIVFLPILIVFIIFQKRLMGNVSMGGIKE
jgi:ABC-type glycerol-3-phosphate transport system permease component